MKKVKNTDEVKISIFTPSSRVCRYTVTPKAVNIEINITETENVVFDGENVIFDGEQVVA